MSRFALGLSLAVFGLCGCASDTQTATPGTSGSGGSTGGSGGANGNGGSGTATGGTAASSGGSTSAGGATSGSGGANGNGGAAPGSGGFPISDASASATADQVKAWIDAYKAAHPGNGGKDWDINAKTPAEIAADPAAQQLLGLCGPDQRPVIPELAWEYGGSDHQWINPQASPLVICVYVAVNPSTDHWTYDAASDHITADAYVLFPDQNPCKGSTGANQVLDCVGDPSNLEILVDTSSIHDGADVGLQLANSSTDVMLILSDGSKVLLVHNV